MNEYSKVNVGMVCLAVVLVIGIIIGGFVVGVTNGQRSSRQIQIQCIEEHGSWISGHCIYPVGQTK